MIRRDLTVAWRAKPAAQRAYEALCAPKRSMAADNAAARSDAPANKVGGGRATISPGVSDSRTAAGTTGAGIGKPG